MPNMTQRVVGLNRKDKDVAIQAAKAKAVSLVGEMSAHDDVTASTRQEIAKIAQASKMIKNVKGSTRGLVVDIITNYGHAPVSELGEFPSTVMVKDSKTGKLHKVQVRLPERKMVDPREWAVSAVLLSHSGEKGLTAGTINFAERTAKAALNAAITEFAKLK